MKMMGKLTKQKVCCCFDCTGPKIYGRAAEKQLLRRDLSDDAEPLEGGWEHVNMNGDWRRFLLGDEEPHGPGWRLVTTEQLAQEAAGVPTEWSAAWQSDE